MATSWRSTDSRQQSSDVPMAVIGVASMWRSPAWRRPMLEKIAPGSTHALSRGSCADDGRRRALQRAAARSRADGFAPPASDAERTAPGDCGVHSARRRRRDSASRSHGASPQLGAQACPAFCRDSSARATTARSHVGPRRRSARPTRRPAQTLGVAATSQARPFTFAPTYGPALARSMAPSCLLDRVAFERGRNGLAAGCERVHARVHDARNVAAPSFDR